MAEPKPPTVNPDPPPAEPRDVQTHPDPPPAGPVPVQVSPDPPPGPPMPVATSPDPGPWNPMAVSVDPDAGPGSPVPVPTSPDGPPGAPVPVQVTADPGPGSPAPVQVAPDPAPTDPAPVQVIPDPPPGSPTPVAVIPDPPPVRDHRQDAHPVLSPPPFDPKSAEDLAGFIGQLESGISKFLLSGAGVSLDKNQGMIGARALDPVFLVQWVRDNLKLSQITSFIAEQGILYAMNDTVGRIFNPGYFFDMAIPGAPGHYVPSDAQGFTNADAALARDAALKRRISSPIDPAGNQLREAGNAYTPEHRADDALDFTVDDMVDAAIDGTGRGTYLSILPGSQNGEGIPPISRFDASKYFDVDRNTGLRSVTKPTVRLISNSVPPRSPLLQAEQGPQGVGIIRMGAQGESPDGAVYSGLHQDPSQGLAGVDDDAVRMPLCFTDLRKDPITDSWRSVYFPAFNLNFTEAYAPEFDEKTAFGRTDPVLNYIRTTRSVTLSWEVTVFVPEDLVRMYNKMRWLASMTYPSYTPDGLMLSGPVIRFRIGDVVATADGGIPGVIRNLSFDFADALWELKKGMKVPRSFQASTELLVLHDGPVGTLNGRFGVLSLPPPGKSRADVNYAPQDNGQTTVAQVMPGKFARFGEPVRKG